MVDNLAMQAAKRIARHVPGLRKLYHFARRAYANYKRQRSTVQEVFTDIYEHNRWGSIASVSGTGSAPDQTGAIVRALPVLLRELGVSTLLDIPCGDFHWMRAVDLNGINYVGGDIVPGLVQRNDEAYGRRGLAFRHLDLITDELPNVDMILCRDGLVHLSYAHIFSAFANMCQSGSKYVLTTTFCGHQDNYDIATGDWRPLNLERPPFRLPKPLRLLNEGCTEADGAYQDKSLGLWDIRDVSRILSGSSGEPDES